MLTQRSLPKVTVLFNINFATPNQTYLGRGKTNILFLNFDCMSSIMYVRHLHQKNNYFKDTFGRSVTVIKIISFLVEMPYIYAIDEVRLK